MNKVRILERSSKLFMSKGCKSVTMDDVASENGISKRTLYELFRDKSHLLEECIRYMDDMHNKHVVELSMVSKNVLELLLRIHNDQSEIMMSRYDNFMKEVKRYHSDVYESTVEVIQKEHNEKTRNMLLSGRDQGVFRKEIDVELTAIMLNEMIIIIENSSIFHKFGYSLKQTVKDTMLVYFRGLSTPEGVKIIDDYFENTRNS